MVGIERIGLLRPVGEDLDEFATLQPAAAPQREDFDILLELSPI